MATLSPKTEAFERELQAMDNDEATTSMDFQEPESTDQQAQQVLWSPSEPEPYPNVSLTSAYNFVAKVRSYIPSLADYLLMFMSVTFQVAEDPLINAVLDSNPRLAQAMILNPNLAALLRCNLDLIPWIQSDIMINIVASLNPWLAEMFLKDPHLAQVCQRNWVSSIQMSYYHVPDQYEQIPGPNYHLPEFSSTEIDQALASVDMNSEIDQLIQHLNC